MANKKSLFQVRNPSPYILEKDGVRYWFPTLTTAAQYAGVSNSRVSYCSKTGKKANGFTVHHGTSLYSFLYDERLYHIWRSMKSRCNNKLDTGYYLYGERGISVCNDWDESYVLFAAWATQSGYNKDLTLDRIDVNGNYCPENCRWATRKEQSNNKRNSLWFEYNGKLLPLSTIASQIGVTYSTLYQRIVVRGLELNKTIAELTAQNFNVVEPFVPDEDSTSEILNSSEN